MFIPHMLTAIVAQRAAVKQAERDQMEWQRKEREAIIELKIGLRIIGKTWHCAGHTWRT